MSEIVIGRKYKLLKDVNICGVDYNAGDVLTFRRSDRYNGKVIEHCFGHGTHWPFEVGIDAEWLPLPTQDELDEFEALECMVAIFKARLDPSTP